MRSNQVRLKFVFRLILSGDSVFLEVVIGDGYVYTDVVGDDNGDVVGDDNGYVTGDGNGDVVGDTLPVKSLPSFSATDAA